MGTLEARNESWAVVYSYMSLDNVMLTLECMWASKTLLESVDCNKTIRAKRPTSPPAEVFRLRLEVPLGSTWLLPAHKSLLNGRRSMHFYDLCYKRRKLEDLIVLSGFQIHENICNIISPSLLTAKPFLFSSNGGNQLLLAGCNALFTYL